MKTINLIFIMLVLYAAEINSQWQQTSGTPQGAGVTDIVVLNDETIIVTTASHNWPNGQPGGIRRSTDGGNTWQNVMNNYNSRTLYLGSSGKLFASCWNYPQNEGMFFSTNNGVNWIQTFFGAANDNVFSIAAKNGDSMVYVGTRNGVFRSFNNGSWVQLVSGMPPNSWVRDLAIIDNIIFAGTTNGLYRSTNHGNSWALMNGITQSDTVVKLSVSVHTTIDNGESKTLEAGTSDGKIYISENYTEVELLYAAVGFEVSGLFRSGDFAVVTLYPRGGMGNGRIIFTRDGGDTWELFDLSGMGSGYLISGLIGVLASPYYKLYIGLYLNSLGGAHVYKYSSLIGISQISNTVAKDYSLSQNYPNPFNPATNIEFSVPHSSFVRLTVYDMLGRAVETLVDKEMKPGVYRADWDASAYSSGVYFYRLESEGFTETKKMMLIK